MRLHAVAPATELYTEERRSITEAIDYSIRLLPHLRQHLAEHDLIVVSVFPYFPVLASSIATVATDTPIVTTWRHLLRPKGRSLSVNSRSGRPYWSAGE